jgi:drug/metabolite transporter (DMT)-like permease
MDLPQGLMASSAQMITGGGVLLLLALLQGNRPTPGAGATPLLAILYLAVFGSIVAYSAYGYLLRHVSPTLATSYAFVNPVIAVLLGAAFAGEEIRWITLLAMAVILCGVALVAVKPRNPMRPLQSSSSLESTAASERAACGSAD